MMPYPAETVDLPPMDHAACALASIALGKPTIIEKPLTHDLGEAVEIYRAARAGAVPVLSGNHLRLAPPFLDMDAGLRRGEIGPITSVESSYVHDMGRLKAGVGWREDLNLTLVYEDGAVGRVGSGLTLQRLYQSTEQALRSMATQAMGVMIALNTLELAAESGCAETVPSLQEVLSRK